MSVKLTVVIAAYDESATIGTLTDRLVQSLNLMEVSEWKLIYVIDGTDGTVDIARKSAAQWPQIEILHSEQPSGLGLAFRRGFDVVPPDADYVVTMDADLNHRPEEISKLLKVALATKADIVVGSRRVEHSRVEGIPLWKDVLSRVVNRVMFVVMGTRINDLTSGFRVYRASALRQIRFENVGFAFLPEMLIDAVARHFTIVEEPIHFVFREAGESKMNVVSTSISYLRLFAKHSFSARRAKSLRRVQIDRPV